MPFKYMLQSSKEKLLKSSVQTSGQMSVSLPVCLGLHFHTKAMPHVGHMEGCTLILGGRGVSIMKSAETSPGLFWLMLTPSLHH